MQTEKVRARRKRLQIQQGVISVVCLALTVFVFVWLIHTAVTGRKRGLLPVSGKAENTSVSDSSSLDVSQPDKSDSTLDSVSDSSSSDSDSESYGYEGAALTDDFSDACFIGDSRTVGLEMNSDKPKADFYASQGLNIGTALTEQVITLENGNLGTVVEGVSQKQYKRIFIMFGINELGWPYPETFVEDYVELIKQIQAVQPDAKIYVQSILPVSSKATQTDEVFTNSNIDAFNEYVKQAADETGTEYLDVNSYFKDASGSLPEDAATDGIHFIKEYCLDWIDLLAYLVPKEANG
jgi:lysophospholipase L1-like esterase